MTPPLRRSLAAAICVPLLVTALAVPTVALVEDDPAPPDAEGPQPITWAIEPSDGEGPDGRISLRHVLEPGGSADDAVVVTNYSTRAATFRVYAGDGTVASGGTFDLSPPDAEPVAGGSWITVGPVEGADLHPSGGLLVEIPAETAVVVPVEIVVPRGATPGDHPAGIVAELDSVDGAAAQLASRVGARVHLRVSGDVVVGLEPELVSATWLPSWNPFAPGTVRVRYTIANDGNVRVGSSGAATVAGPFGLGASSAPSEQREILPGEVAHVEAELGTWPFVRTGGELTVIPGVVGEDDIDVPLTSVTTRYAVWTVPWSQLALVLLVGAAVYLVRWRRRSVEARTEERIAEAVAAATAGRGRGADDAPAEAAAVVLPDGEGHSSATSLYND